MIFGLPGSVGLVHQPVQKKRARDESSTDFDEKVADVIGEALKEIENSWNLGWTETAKDDLLKLKARFPAHPCIRTFVEAHSQILDHTS